MAIRDLFIQRNYLFTNTQNNMKTVKKDTDYFNPFLDMDGGAMGVKDRQNAKYFTERAKNRLAMKKGKKRAIKPSLDSARQQSRILEMLD